jgi:hypothetical protein
LDLYETEDQRRGDPIDDRVTELASMPASGATTNGA